MTALGIQDLEDINVGDPDEIDIQIYERHAVISRLYNEIQTLELQRTHL